MVSSYIPPCVTIAIYAMQWRKTLAAMLQSKAFVLGIPSIDQVKEADYLSVESGYNTDKIRNIGYTTVEAKTVHAPVINELPLSLEWSCVGLGLFLFDCVRYRNLFVLIEQTSLCRETPATPRQTNEKMSPARRHFYYWEASWNISDNR